MHDPIKPSLWSNSPWSSTVSQLTRTEHGHICKWNAEAEGIHRPKSLNWQKTGNGAGCHDHFTACRGCQQHLDEQDSQLCSSLVALQQTMWQTLHKGPDAESDVDWSWKSCMQGWRNEAVAWGGCSSKAHGDTTSRQYVGIGGFWENFRLCSWNFWNGPLNRLIRGQGWMLTGHKNRHGTHS